MSDPFDVLRDELVAAEGRMLRGRRRSRWLRRRSLLLAAALVVATGTAAAAVVSLTSEDSAPLAGTVPAPSPNVAQRAYRIELMPDLRAGQIGWCTTLALRSRRGPIGSGTGCGPAAPADAAQIAGGAITVGRDRIILFTIVDKRVATVRLHDGRTIAPLPDRRLPYGWRAAVAFVTRDHGNVAPTDLDWTLQDTDGRPISTAPNSRAGTKRAGTATLPTRTVDPRNPPHSRCAIRARPLRHLRAVSAEIVKRMPTTTPDVNGRAFLACATTIYYLGDHRYRAAILLDARDRRRPAADLPGSSPRAGSADLVDAAGHITARRAGAGWLAVQGPSARERAVVLRALRAHP